MTNFNVYRIFNDTKSYYMVSKLKKNLCLNLLLCYYNKFKAQYEKMLLEGDEDGNIPTDMKSMKNYQPYYELFNGKNDIELIDTFSNRDDAKKSMMEKIAQSQGCLNKREQDKNVSSSNISSSTGTTKETNKIKKGGKMKEDKKAILKEYNKKKYRENKETFKQYYQTNKDKIRAYQKTRYEEIKQKLNELEELKK